MAAVFYTHHLRPMLGGAHLALVAGLTEPSHPEPHAVQSFDWFRPTAGELAPSPAVPDHIHRDLVEARLRAEQQCREALSPKLHARFDLILELAQLYARLREEQVGQLTLGWALARRALRRLGETCVHRGVAHEADDVCFLERREIGLDEPVSRRWPSGARSGHGTAG